MKSSLALILALMLFTLCAQAETHVPAGPVSGIWTLTGSPFIIEGNIYIVYNASLGIQPGVTVIQNPGCRFRIEGQLQAVGTQTDSIRFLAADTTIGSEGLHFYNTNQSTQDSSHLDYCVVSYGVASLPPDPYMHGGGIYIKNSSNLRISHCYIHHCRTDDVIGAHGINGQPGTFIGGPGSPGASVTAGSGGAIYIEYCNPLITYCLFAYNFTGTGRGGIGGNGGDAINFGGTANGGAGGLGGYGNGGGGGAIFLQNSETQLQANIFHDNHTGKGYGGAGGNGGYAYADYTIAHGGYGGLGGQGSAGMGGAIFFNSSGVIQEDNVYFSNSTDSGVGGNGGHGGGASGGPGLYGQPGAGGQGGNGNGGEGYALFSNSTITTANYSTFTQQLQISLGTGGVGGWNGVHSIQAGPGQGINGQYVVACSTATLTNSITWNNVTPSINPSAIVTYSDIQGGFPGQGNISSDPLFVAGPGGGYYLSQIASGQTQNSPCLDAGNPASPMIVGTTRTDQVQDAGIVDMGFHYPITASVPNLDVTLTPLNPPIQIPANGGSFNFNISVVRNVGPPTPYTVWARIKNPDGSYTAPTLGPVTINTPVGVTITRQRTQTVPGTWAAGVYTYLGYANTTYSYPAVDSSSFTFTKSATGDGGATIWEATCTGESFPGEEFPPLLRGDRGDFVVASPNPFNPTTAISYQLQASSHVSLIVYDTAGRLVTTLVDGWREAGTHEVTFDGSRLASGIYLVQMQAGEFAAVQKVMLLK